MKASLLSTVLSATTSSLSSQIATQVTLGILAQQSPGDILNAIARPETLKGAITSAATAGTLYELGSLQNASGTSTF